MCLNLNWPDSTAIAVTFFSKMVGNWNLHSLSLSLSLSRVRHIPVPARFSNPSSPTPLFFSLSLFNFFGSVFVQSSPSTPERSEYDLGCTMAKLGNTEDIKAFVKCMHETRSHLQRFSHC